MFIEDVCPANKIIFMKSHILMKCGINNSKATSYSTILHYKFIIKLTMKFNFTNLAVVKFYSPLKMIHISLQNINFTVAEIDRC